MLSSFILSEKLYAASKETLRFINFISCLQGALYVLLNNRMIFLIVHYWEVMVDVWPVIVQVRIVIRLYYMAVIRTRALIG